MLRGTDAPTTVTGRLDQADDQLDELARAQARGTEAVRNDAGHKLFLNPQNPNPLLIAVGGNTFIDSGLGFSAGTLQVVSQDGQQWRNIEALGLILHDSINVGPTTIGQDGISTTGDLSVGTLDATLINSSGILRGNSAQITNNIIANGVTAGNAGITSNGTIGTFGQLRSTTGVVTNGQVQAPSANLAGNLDANGANFGTYGMWSTGNTTTPATATAGWQNVNNTVTTWGLNATGNVSLAGRAWNAVVGVVDTLWSWWNALPSGQQLKEGFADVDEADADALLAAPVQRWTWAPRMTEQPLAPGAHGPLNLVDIRADQREHYGPIAEDVPDILRVVNPDDEGHYGIDLHGYLGLLLHICQRQERQIKDLTARVGQLEDRLAAPGN